ncbi:MAG: SOS response-associated peptidase [Acidimicrobiales bacterium]|jgi:putative SOS response-associated peptidase YedK
MCGRFVASRPVEDIAALLEVDDLEVPEELLAPRWNVAPTDGVLAVATRVRKDTEEERRRLTDYRWGLVPSWAKDPAAGVRAFNARAETLLERPAFRTALLKRRCLIPADAFYEWEKITASPGGRVLRRQPWCFTAADGGLLAFAGLWEAWKAPGEGDPETMLAGAGWHDRWLLSCTVITTTANAAVEPLHDRMPVILRRDDWATWLDPSLHEAGELTSLLQPAPAGLLRSYAVSPAVNNAQTDGPQLVAPLAEAADDERGDGEGGEPRLVPLF